MDLTAEFFTDLLIHYEYANINSLLSASPTEVHQSPYVLVAHVIGIISTNTFGVVVNVEDHTGIATLALRDDAALYFYEEHIRSPDHPDPITDPYALNDTWFGTYLFVINQATQISLGSNNAFIVHKICMKRAIMDRFFQCQMDESECLSYRRSMALAVLCGVGYWNIGGQGSSNDSVTAGIGTCTRKRVYAPYMP